MKKFEESEISIRKLTKLKYGEDLEIIRKHLDKFDIELNQENIDSEKLNIKYRLKLYYFKEGQNSFTINLEERIKFIEKRKKKAVEFLKKGDFKKSLKLFHKIDNLSEFGVFDEDKKTMLPYKLSAKLNISLIYWK